MSDKEILHDHSFRIKAFQRETESLDEFTNEINYWIEHSKPDIVNCDFGYTKFGNLRTVVIIWRTR